MTSHNSKVETQKWIC